MIYTSLNQLYSPVGFFFRRNRVRNLARIKLIKEINFNLRLIDMMDWKGVSKEFKMKVVGEFTIKDFENFLEVCSSDIFDQLSRIKVKYEVESSDDKVQEDSELVSSLINKIKTLQIIAGLNKNFEDDDKSRFENRLSNIKKGLNELKQTLNS